MATRLRFQQGLKVRLATYGESPTDPIGEVIEVTEDDAGQSWVRVKWPWGSEKRFHPTALDVVGGRSLGI